MDVSTTGDGYYVGWMRIDEYLRFTVDVAEDGMKENTMPKAMRRGFILITNRTYVTVKCIRYPPKHFPGDSLDPRVDVSGSRALR